MAKCEGCKGLGYRMATRDEGLLAIEKCDTCERFPSDEDARNHVAECGHYPKHIHIEPDYPCYLWVDVDGRAYRLSTKGL